MTSTLSAIVVSRLEKAATDNGFDHALELESDWLAIASMQCPLRVWLGASGGAVFLAAYSQRNVARGPGRRADRRAAELRTASCCEPIVCAPSR
ncbi:MAG TPA: hypothetical protein DFS52_22355 [Myxococcales bacterium]|nr:hypothetical protein [Myxococcales bacterium]